MAIVLVLPASISPSPQEERSGAADPARQETRPRTLGRRIRERLDDRQAVREKYRQAREDHRRQLEAVEGQISRLQGQVERLRRENRVAGEALERRSAELEERRSFTSSAQRDLARLGDEGLVSLRATLRRVGAGVPVLKAARLSALARSAVSLESEDPLERARGIERFLSLFDEDLQLARVREVRSELIAVSADRRLHARVVQLGLVNLLFALETGDEVGIAVPDPGERWRSSIEAEERESIRAVFDILERRCVPEVTPVPFPAPRADPKESEGVKER